MKAETAFQFTPTIVIENFPSRLELFSIINEFLSKCQLAKEYETFNQHNCVRLKFQSHETAYQLLSHLTQLSLSHQLYCRLKCYLLIEPDNKITENNVSLSDIHIRKGDTQLRMKTLGAQTSISTSVSASRINLKKQKSSKHRRFHTSHDVQLTEGYIHKHFSDIRSKAGIMSTASPYLTEEEKLKIKDKLSKEKNITTKDFRLFIGKATINKSPFIKNYVSLTPSECSDNNILFRKENKKKWICTKKFWV